MISSVLRHSLLSALVLLTSLSSFALKSPDELITSSGNSNSELLDTILELKENVGSISDYRSFKAYFALIDDFKELAAKHNLDSIYPGAVAGLADTLASHGMRWVQVTKTPNKEIKALVSVMSARTLLRFLNDLETQIAYLPEDFDSAKVGLVLSEIREVTLSSHPQDQQIEKTLSRISSALSQQILLKDSDLSAEDFGFWLEGLRDDTAIVNYLLALYSQVISASPKQMSVLTTKTFAMGSHLNSFEHLPLSTWNVYGDLYVELIGKMVEREVVVEDEKLKESLSHLRVNHLQGIVYRLLNPVSMPSSEYTQDYLILVRLVANELKHRGLDTSAHQLLKETEARMAASVAVIEGHEGTYQIIDQAGKEWTFTLVRSTEDRLIASISLNKGTIYLSFLNVTYSLYDDNYKASAFVPDDDPYANPVVQFSFPEKGKIQLRLPFALEGNGDYQGQKTQSYPDYFSKIKSDAPLIESKYQGLVHLPSGRSMMMTLTIFLFDDYAIGRLESLDKRTRIELQHGTQGGEGFIYLTSGQSPARSWFHLRLQQPDESRLTGHAIVGGQGIGQESSFKKIEN